MMLASGLNATSSRALLPVSVSLLSMSCPHFQMVDIEQQEPDDQDYAADPDRL